MNLRFGEHIVVYQGSIENADFVSHQACCVVTNDRQAVSLEPETGTVITSQFFVIPSWFPHRIVAKEPTYFVFVDPNRRLAKQNAALLYRAESEQAIRIQQLLSGAFESVPIAALERVLGGSTHLDHRIAKAVEYLKSNLHRTLTTQEIAASCFLSESRLQHLFKAQIGMPIRKYLHWQRIVAATQFALQGHPLTAAAYEGGFSDAAHFTRTFKKMFGVPPSFFFAT